MAHEYICNQREWGQWAVYYTSPQSFVITFLFVWISENIFDFLTAVCTKYIYVFTTQTSTKQQ